MTANTSPGLIVGVPAAAAAVVGSLPPGYLTGLRMVKTGFVTLTVKAGSARDEANTLNLELLADTPVDFSDVGVLNGADVAISNSHRIIYVWVVGGIGQTTGILVSESATAPTLLPSYTAQFFIGSIPIDVGEGPEQRDWMQQGSGRSRTVRLGPQDEQESLVGGPWQTGNGQIPGVSASTDWRNIVAGGTDVQFDPSERVPARPAGAGGSNAERGIRVLFLFITRLNINDFIEVAPAFGILELPTSSPVDGESNARVYQIQTNQTVEMVLQVGDNQTLQYRCTDTDLEYMISIVGWVDELGS